MTTIEEQLHRDRLEDNLRCSEQCNLTVDQAARHLQLKVYDTALPQGWVDDMRSKGFDPLGKVVWCYDVSTALGAPVGLLPGIDAEIKKLTYYEQRAYDRGWRS